MDKKMKKRIFIVLSMIIALVSILPKQSKNICSDVAIAKAATWKESYYYMSKRGVVTTSSLNLNKRIEPSTSAKIVGKLSRGSQVIVVGISRNNSFYKLDDGSYVSSEYIRLVEDVVIDGWKKFATTLNENYVLDVSNGGKENGTNIQIWQNDNATPNQRFYVKYVGNSFYRIIDANGKSLDASNGLSTSTNIQVWDQADTDAQLYRIINMGEHRCMICPKSSTDMFLNVYGGSVANGTNVWTYRDDNTLSGIWKIIDSLAPGTNTGSNANGITYAEYTGVNYANSGISSQRIAALNKAKAMTTVLWKTNVSFPAWQAANGSYNSVKATDGTVSTRFLAGKTYQGIPYSMVNHSYDDIAWIRFVNSGFTSNSMSARYGSRTSTTAKGIDCSYFTYLCFKAANTGYAIDYQDTSSMLKSRYYSKKSINNILPGDIALRSGHVMLYVGRAGNNYAFFEADANDSKCSYNVYSYQYVNNQYQIYRFNGFPD